MQTRNRNVSALSAAQALAGLPLLALTGTAVLWLAWSRRSRIPGTAAT
jgi:hypothetical protein